MILDNISIGVSVIVFVTALSCLAVVANLLFDYEVWHCFRQVFFACLGAKTASVMQNCEIWGLGQGVPIFGQDLQKALPWPETRVLIYS